MPDYKTGSYIIQSKKNWPCNHCPQFIKADTKYFARVKEYGEKIKRFDGKTYRLKIYHRYHINCARNFENLNEFEKSLLMRNIGV